MKNKKMITTVLAALTILAGTSVSASAVASGELGWLDGVPDFPVEPGTSPTNLTEEDKSAIAQFHVNFPWERAFEAFGCAVSDLEVSSDGGKSMLIDCSSSAVDLDDVASIPGIAIAAADGDESALASLRAGRILESDSSLRGSACSNQVNQRHCLDNDAQYLIWSSGIRTLSGSATGVNRLGLVGFGNPCADGTLQNQSGSVAIDTKTISLVTAPSWQSTQLSSRWTMSIVSYTRFCALV